MSRTHALSIEAALILGEDWDTGSGIVVKQPMLGEILRWGELDYYRTVGLLTCISSDCKAALYDMGIMWYDLTDFDMFCIATHGLTPDDTSILLGEELNLSKLHLYASPNGRDNYLADDDGKPIITYDTWLELHNFICRMHRLVKNPEFPGNDFAREMLLEESRASAAQAQADGQRPILPTAISYVANAPGSKYGYKECMELKYSTFMDCLARTQIISEATALRSACLSGMIDTSKIDPEDMNMLREIKTRKPKSPVTDNAK